MTRLASHFRHQADEPRVARVWSALDARLDRARRKQRALWGAAAAFAIGAAAGLALYLPDAVKRDRSVAAPTPQVLQLADGSRVEHAAGTHVAIESVSAQLVELHMTRGRAQFRVTPNRQRTFLTHAGGYTIRVVGTEFAVELESTAVRVAVTRGEVEVRRDGSADVWRVRAGESWDSGSAPAAAVLPPAPPAAVPMQPGAAARPVPAPLAQKPRRPDAAALFQLAQQARADAQILESEHLLAEFLQRFPNDPRASLAAFQLGRTRLELGDARGALAALDRAAGDGNAFAEQVEARRVQALDQLGDREGCRSARAKFLREFPSGSFAELVRQRCP
ncbi:MAG TPA: FecR domain-containing protein [Polyangiales bacterium]|nr:FecR domain-containing protein [Polyangiales bacterium]